MSWHAEIERCRPWIEAALEYTNGTHTFDDIVACVEAGTMQFWAAPGAAAITEVIQYPQKKALNIFLAGGELPEILDRMEACARWGRIEGCTELTMTGRPGWARVLAKLGWKQSMVTLGKDITK